MKTINQAITLLFLLGVILFAACNGPTSPSTVNPTDVMETSMAFVKTEIVETLTAAPTGTAAHPHVTAFIPWTVTPTFISTSIPTIPPTVVTTPVPYTAFGTMHVQWIGKFGETGVAIFRDDPFQFFEGGPEYMVGFRFTMHIAIAHFITNELTPTPTAIPTSNWRLSIYRYRPDGAYTDQPVHETDLKTVLVPESKNQHPGVLQMSLTADVTRRDLQTRFGDCRAFTFQVRDEHQEFQQQGYFYITPDRLLSQQGGIKGNYQDGITIGYPYSLQENETEFFRQGKFIVIDEPPGGFYRLSYTFNFAHAAGISAVVEQEKAASELSIRLFPYREDGKYFSNNSHPATAIVKSVIGFLVVDLPIDYLQENASSDNKYYLQIMDSEGKVIKDEYFTFIPDIP